MLEIKCEQTILQADLPEEHRKLLLKLWQALANIPGYEPDSDGYIVYLISEQSLAAMGLESSSFDGGCYYPEANCYELISICNNSFGWTIVLPRSETFNPEKLTWLSELLEEGDFDPER